MICHVRPSRQTPILSLAQDDLVPSSILLALGYDYDVSSSAGEALQRGLDAFPHLAGRLIGEVEPFAMSVHPSDQGVRLEFQQDRSARLDSLWKMSSTLLVDRFFPVAACEAHDQFIRSPLLSIRVTSLCNNACVIGMLVSHMLVDGVGLIQFLKHCLGGLKATAAPVPIHCRSVLTQQLIRDAELPSWYNDENAEPAREHEWELARRMGQLVFTVREDAVRKQFDWQSTSTWIQLTAILCRELSDWGGYGEVAFWCDVRGSLAIPPAYSGNVGCYMHTPLVRSDDGPEQLAARLRAAIQSDGGHRIAETYSAIKIAEQNGRRVRWTGTQRHVLPINLVPHSPSMLNFGGGGPVLSRILTRNVHGLRITRVPTSATHRDRSFLVEACLPSEVLEQLTDRCRSLGLMTRQLCMET